MAKKHVEEYLRILETEYNQRAEALISRASGLFQIQMVDPETVEETKTNYSKIADYYNTLASILDLAKNNNQFYLMYRQTASLKNTILTTKSKVAEQEPDSPLIKNYEEVLKVQEERLAQYYWVWKILSQPRSKKRRKVWERRGWWITQERFLPFIELENRLKTFEEYLKEEFE